MAHGNFREFVLGHRMVYHPGTSEDDIARCFVQFCVAFVRELGQQIDMRCLKGNARFFAQKYPGYTPGMVMQYCRHVFHAARARAIRSAQGRDVSAVETLPTESDFDLVEQAIEGAVPGHIVWKPTYTDATDTTYETNTQDPRVASREK